METQAIEPNKTVRPEDIKRLTGQNLAIYKLLSQGWVSNDHMAAIARKYTSRISDIRAWLAINHPDKALKLTKREPGGLCWYEITDLNGDENG